MIYLIEYDRRSGMLIEMRAFADDQRELAENARLALELALHAQKQEREVVLLEAADEAGLRRTHGRYFQSLQSLAAQGAEIASG